MAQEYRNKEELWECIVNCSNCKQDHDKIRGLSKFTSESAKNAHCMKMAAKSCMLLDPRLVIFYKLDHVRNIQAGAISDLTCDELQFTARLTETLRNTAKKHRRSAEDYMCMQLDDDYFLSQDRITIARLRCSAKIHGDVESLTFEQSGLTEI